MAALVHFDAQGQWGETLVCEQRVGEALRRHGFDYGRWPLRDIGDASLQAVQAAYADELAALGSRVAICSSDRVTLRPDQPGWPALRQKFIAEHTHADAEIRFFLGGAGLFYLRTDAGHLALLCEAQDWVVVPAGTRHRFDAGDAPDFDALRLFTAPDGALAQPTGEQDLPALPLMDDFVEELLALTGHAADDFA